LNLSAAQTHGCSVASQETIHSAHLGVEPEATDETRSLVSTGVYRYYVKAAGRIMSLVFAIVGVAFAFLYTFPYVWTKWWSDANEEHPGHRQAYYMGIYALLQVLCLIALVAFAWQAVIVVITSAGTSLHWTLIKTTLQAPSFFFDQTDTGKTLNRFSQDVQLIDSELPSATLKVAYNGLIVLGQLLLIMNTSYWIAISYPIIFFILWGIQRIYVRTSRRLRHLELESKSPLYSQFVESLDGLVTIRAFNWQRHFKRLNYQRLDQSQRPFYLLLCIQRWLGLVLDCLSAGFVLLLVGLIITLRDGISVGFVGVAMTNMINLSSLMTSLVDVWTEMETSVTSIQRIRDFETETPSEFLDNISNPPDNWPSHGAVEIHALNAAYREGAPLALKNISMSIQPGEKIGICGRTGSGKTSLMLALFRMIEIPGGSIRIDGLDTSSVALDRVRTALNAIPQTSWFVEGTYRLNADPFGTTTDEEIWRALKLVHLDGVVQREGGLEADMGRDALSHGERQLLGLARAILKRSRIVVLDEATSK
jgi:ATP-binding cassette, subfamily C (CFTR/MRP), member 1